MRTPAVLLLLAILPLAGCFTPESAGDDGLAPTGGEAPATDGQASMPPASDEPSAGSTQSDPDAQGPPAPGGGFDNGSDDGNATPLPREWAPLGSAMIRPGVQVLAGGSQCTSNFLFTSLDLQRVYLGFAAHCVTHGDPNAAEDGCDPASDPMEVGTPLEVEGADHPAKLAYTSWGTMQAAGEDGAAACAFNDFALAELDARDAAKANPAMLFFGGPTDLVDPAGVGMLDKVLTYGDSGLRAGLAALSPHEGYVVSPPGPGGWTTQVYTVPQGIPGDSGSGVLLEDGQALGILVTISFAGGSNGVTTLANAMAYAAAAGLATALATTDQFEGGTLPPV